MVHRSPQFPRDQGPVPSRCASAPRARDLSHGGQPGPRRVTIPGPMDSHPSHHWLKPPLRRGRKRACAFGRKPTPLVRIPKPLPRRRLPKVAERLAREDERLASKAEKEDYFHPPWHRPVGILPCMSQCSNATAREEGFAGSDSLRARLDSVLEYCRDGTATVADRELLRNLHRLLG